MKHYDKGYVEGVMEEDIEILEQIKESIDIDYGTGRRKVQAIENLINRNKEIEQLEREHKKENGELRKKIKELEEEQCCLTSCMRKDKERLFLEVKIKEVIEELRKEFYKLDKEIDIKKPNKTMQDYYEDKERITTMQTISYVIGKLEEVLGG